MLARCRLLFEELRQKAKYPTANTIKRALQFTVLANVLPLLWGLKYTENVTKYRLSLSRWASRLYGSAFHCELPESWRGPVYSAFARTFGANLLEAGLELPQYKSLDEFFTRELKGGLRPLGAAALVSPCDGRVLSAGSLDSNLLQSIKGRFYSFSRLLTGSEQDFARYKDSLMKDPQGQLRYMTIYLSPGDCHRFYAPADWKIHSRRHVLGYLLGVFKFNIWRKRDLFSNNERVAYFGEYPHGGLHMCLVGAYNVGSIEVFCDRTLETNRRTLTNEDLGREQELACEVRKGGPFGVFHAGSTIVIIAEMPVGQDWAVCQGSSVHSGQNLITTRRT